MDEDFVATMAHELRTPLTAIQGSVKTLLHFGPELDEETKRSLLAAIERQSERLGRMIEELLAQL